MKATANTESQASDRFQPEDIVEAAQNARKSRRRITKLRTVGTFLRRGACSNTMMTVLDRADGHPLDSEEHATDPLAGGLMQGYQCGMLWGATLSAGAQAHRRFGPGPRAQAAAMTAAEKLVDAFRAMHGTIDCLDITDTDPKNTWQTFKYFLLKGGTVACARRMARFAPVARQAIDDALSAESAHEQSGCNPASCAARLARKMGASELHQTMAAGLAGGMGFSGGACGALGAAIWLIGLQGREAGLSTKAINHRISETTERFQQASDYAFECADIVGRRFADQADHARHLATGGCEPLLDLLASCSLDQPSTNAPLADAA